MKWIDCFENKISYCTHFLFYFFATQSGPLVGIEKRIRSGLEYIEPDFLDDYVSGK